MAAAKVPIWLKNILSVRFRTVGLQTPSMVGNSDMARTYALIAEGNGRAVMSGDEAQLEAIAPGAPFRLAQGRSAIDMAVMKEIVRQTPELKPAVYKMIDNDVPGALDVVRSVAPANVPRQANAWVPAKSVMELAVDIPDIHDAIVSDYLGVPRQPGRIR